MRLKLYTIFILISATLVFAQEYGTIPRLNSGILSTDMEGRIDTEQYYSGMREQENFLSEVYGGIVKRPGTYYIAQEPNSYTNTYTVNLVEGTYPTLQIADTTFEVRDPCNGLTHTTAIASLSDLEDIANDMEGNYYLTQDIDASGTQDPGYNGGAGWDMLDQDFNGTLDGCGYKITGFYQNATSTHYGGIFRYLDNGSVVANLTIENAEVTCTRGGILAYQAQYTAEIYNCHSSGTITLAGSNTENLGGLIGVLYGSVSWGYMYDCTSSATVDAYSTHTDTSVDGIGGLVGLSSGRWTLTNCRATGDVKAHCSGNTGAIGIGGLIGHCTSIFNFTLFYDCAATGDVEGDDYVGGFAGGTYISRLYRCSARGDVIASDPDGDTSGGFVGHVGNTQAFQDCYAWGDVTTSYSTGTGYAGGFAGQSSSTQYQVYAIGSCTGVTTGGVSANGGTWTDCYWDTEASGEATSEGSGAVGYDTEDMKTQSTYAETWDFDTVWEMEDYSASSETTEAVENTSEAVRLLGFEHSIEDAFVLEFSDYAIRFYQ